MVLAPGCCSFVAPVTPRRRRRREGLGRETSNTNSCSTSESSEEYPLRAFEPVWIIPPDVTVESEVTSQQRAYLCAVAPSCSTPWAQIMSGNAEDEGMTLHYDTSTYVTMTSEFSCCLPDKVRRMCKILDESPLLDENKSRLSLNLALRKSRILLRENVDEIENATHESFASNCSGRLFGAVFCALPFLKEQQSGAVRKYSVLSAPTGPTPLSSVTLKIVPGPESSTERSHVLQGNGKDVALRHTCLKRQLCGRVLFFEYRDESASVNADRFISSTTELTLPHFSGRGNYSRVCYCVVDAKPMIHTRTRSQSCGHPVTGSIFLVLPSTQIHLVEEGDNHLDARTSSPSRKPTQETPSSPSHKSELLSPATRALNDAIRIVLSQGNSSIGVDVPRAFLLSGPPGVGKTFAVRTAVELYQNQHEASVRLISIRGSDLLADGRGTGEAAAELQQIFSSAAKRADSGVVLIFLDECDALLSSAGDSATAGALGALLDTMGAHKSQLSLNHDVVSLPAGDDISWREDDAGWKRILVVASTNKIDAIPPFLRRPGRFDREICVSPPTSEERLSMLRSLLSPYHNDTSSAFMIDGLVGVADSCVGYVAADLAALVRKAALLTLGENAGQSPVITSQHLQAAMSDVGASALRDAALSAPPATRWDDIAGDAGGAKIALRRAVEWPRTKKAAFEALGLVPPRGILMHGPPGCAKTTLARAAAGDSGVAFLSLSPADVYASSYVGEAEAVVRRAFILARSAAPCILFFDEIDSILGCSDESGGCGQGGGHGMGRGSSAEARVLSTFLNEMDGVDGSIEDGVLVLGATNRPSILDAALLRPGRFDKVIYVPPPDHEGRRLILRQQAEVWRASIVVNHNDKLEQPNALDLDHFAQDCMSGSMTGAELVGACKEAAMLAVREAHEKGLIEFGIHKFISDKEEPFIPRVTREHLKVALRNVKPLLSNSSLLQEYAHFEDRHNAN